MTFRTSPPNHPLAPTGRSERQFRNVKFGKIGVRGFYIIMRARHERVNTFSAKPIFGRKKKVLGNFIATLVFMLEWKILSSFF